MLLHNYTSLAANALTLSGGGVGSDTPAFLGLRDQTFLALQAGEGALAKKAAVPNGYAPGDAWYPAAEAGSMSSGGSAELTGSGFLAAGRALEATGIQLLLSQTNATLDQIVALGGSGSLVLTGSAAASVIVVAEATGSGSIAGTAQLGAKIEIQASGSGSLTGAAAQGARAFMVASAGGPEPLTPDGLAKAVWSALDADNNVPGTMGAKLNAAGTAGDPWSAIDLGVYPEGTAGRKLNDLVNVNPALYVQVDDVWKRLGLDPANPLVNTDSLIAAGSGLQIFVEQTAGAITTTRQP